MKRNATLLALLLGAAALLSSCGGGRPHKKQVGPIKEWIVGEWVRSDDGIGWNFSADGQMITSGRVPIGGSYSTEEPDKVRVHIAGSNALSASLMLGLPVDANQNLYADFVVKDDEMRPVGIKSSTVFRKQ
ncbi:MAG: hypothetical protein HY293_11945 [Planctomycetes bacterium]|nr:hypothetical protein [Planctomycetota bacterium]